MNKEEISRLAQQLLFELNEEELQAIEEYFVVLQAQQALLDEIDTSMVEPLVYPFESESTYLREDIVSDIMETKDVLQNAATLKNDMILVAKVINR